VIAAPEPRAAVRWSRRLPACVWLLTLALLAACASPPPAPIVDRNATPPVGNTYRVQAGDTLYSIAWRYGFDYRRLAAANNLRPPYQILVGQSLALREAEPLPEPPPSRDVRRTTSPTVKPAESTSASRGSRTQTPATRPSPDAASETREPAPQAGSRSSTSPTSPAPAMTPPPVSRPRNTPVGTWRWPAQGEVVRRFSGTVHKGIDIGGAAGDPVQAVAAGTVVYAGAGIPGYGQLIILRHNERYLSAYGHNERLLVGEGDAVAAGQRIATRGSSGTDSVKLHFEIRDRGKPVDPLGLLPSR
jgi:lipoprotein NlpD